MGNKQIYLDEKLNYIYSLSLSIVLFILIKFFSYIPITHYLSLANNKLESSNKFGVYCVKVISKALYRC